MDPKELAEKAKKLREAAVVAEKKATEAKEKKAKDAAKLAEAATKAKEAAEAAEKEAKDAADGEGAADDGEGHDDADKDKELIKKMLDEYAGKMEEGEAEAMESLAKEAYEAHKEMGGSEKEAYERAGHAIKLAKHMASKQAASEAAAKEAKEAAEKEAKEKECADADKAAKESARTKTKTGSDDRVKELESKLLEATGKIAKLEAQASKSEVEKYVDTKLAESKQPRSVTKRFLEAAGEIKSKADFDAKWKLFSEGIKDVRGEVDYGVLMEKAAAHDVSDDTAAENDEVDFSDCAED